MIFRELNIFVAAIYEVCMIKDKMQDVSAHWERLSAVIEQAGMSTNYFARYIGLPVAENLYRIKRGQNGLSRHLADRIVRKFPNISKGWLLTGEGNMYYDEGLLTSQIPYYNENIVDVLSGNACTPVCHLSISPLKDCEIAIKYDFNGSNEWENTLFLSRIEKDMLLNGKEYLFMVKKLLYLQKWNADRPMIFGEDDKIFEIKGRMSLCKD